MTRSVHYVWNLRQGWVWAQVESQGPAGLVTLMPCGTQSLNFRPNHYTDDPDNVTCRRCLKNLEEGR